MSIIPALHPERAGARGRAGFTILELLVALMVAGILTTIILQLVQGNSRFVSMQSAREEVQQNGRAALDLIASDLRAVPPRGFTAKSGNSVHFYLPRAWGILCNEVTEFTTVAYVVFPLGSFPSDFKPGQQHWGIALEQTADPSSTTGNYLHRSSVSPQSAGTTCNAVQPIEAGAHDARGFSGGAFALPGLTLRPGTQVMVFEETGYDVNELVSGANDFWIRRMAGYGSGGTREMQPMAGPVPAQNALSFTYLDTDGVTEVDPSAADFASRVRKIRIRVVLQSRSKMPASGELRPMQVDTMATEVTLRNL